MLKIFLTVFISCLLTVDGFLYEKDYRNMARFKRQSGCGTQQFQCNSKQCIEDWLVCDGTSNCNDGSDETAKLCSSIICPPSSFRCAYGACIYIKLKCDGAKDCRDNSDEDAEGCQKPTTPRPKSTPKPTKIIDTKGDGKTCSTLSEKNNLMLSCSLDGRAVSCENPPEGTKATVRCAEFYQDPSVATRPLRKCEDGSWDYPLPNCEPVCGEKMLEVVKLVVGGRDAARGEFPWHVGLYRDTEYIGGGSLITPKLVLTAAHAFYESNVTEKYLIAAGKYFSAINHTNDDQAQYSKISDIILHEYYKDHSFEAYDIALVVLIDPFTITKYVMPVCLDLSNNFNMSSLINKPGIVVGWGYTESNTTAEHLKYLKVDYKEKENCTMPQGFSRYYIPSAPDKLCAGFLNQGKSACNGDSGGGLVFPDENGLYFLRGIVSVGMKKPSNNSICDSNQFSLYTSVQFHVKLIDEWKTKYRV